jgi:hypothetical protein
MGTSAPHLPLSSSVCSSTRQGSWILDHSHLIWWYGLQTVFVPWPILYYPVCVLSVCVLSFCVSCLFLLEYVKVSHFHLLPDIFSEFANRIRPRCTTMPWTIRPALVVLWGVCWMFYYGNLHFTSDALRLPVASVSSAESLLDLNLGTVSFLS